LGNVPNQYLADYVVAVFTEIITDQYQQIWLTEIKSNNKLETYVLLKNEFIKENYIDILKEKHLLRAMSRLRPVVTLHKHY
jgi:NAD(P)H-nitrite reductase large subunit